MREILVAAVDIGETNQRVAIVGIDGAIRARYRGRLAVGTPADILEEVAVHIDELANGVPLHGIGIVFPGAVDVVRGRTVTLNPLADLMWDAISAPEVLRHRFDVPVIVENDANAAAVGEGWIGVASGLNDFAFLALGSAIGAGLVIGGRLHRGARFVAGEVAFFPMTRDELHVNDWQHVLALLVGGMGAARHAIELLGEQATAADLFAAARAGAPQPVAWLAEVQEYLAMAVANVAALLDPDAIVFGGGVAIAQGDWFIEPIRALAQQYMPGRPQVLLSSLGEDAQLLGAARLALDQVAAP